MNISPRVACLDISLSQYVLLTCIPTYCQFFGVSMAIRSPCLAQYTEFIPSPNDVIYTCNLLLFPIPILHAHFLLVYSGYLFSPFTPQSLSSLLAGPSIDQLSNSDWTTTNSSWVEMCRNQLPLLLLCPCHRLPLLIMPSNADSTGVKMCRNQLPLLHLCPWSTATLKA